VSLTLRLAGRTDGHYSSTARRLVGWPALFRLAAVHCRKYAISLTRHRRRKAFILSRRAGERESGMGRHGGGSCAVCSSCERDSAPGRHDRGAAGRGEVRGGRGLHAQRLCDKTGTEDSGAFTVTVTAMKRKLCYRKDDPSSPKFSIGFSSDGSYECTCQIL